MINIGDLVRCRSLDQKVGLVVDKRISDEGVNISMHTKHLLGNYPRVYYVFFAGVGKMGPYHETDLILQQSHSFNH